MFLRFLNRIRYQKLRFYSSKSRNPKLQISGFRISTFEPQKSDIFPSFLREIRSRKLSFLNSKSQYRNAKLGIWQFRDSDPKVVFFELGFGIEAQKTDIFHSFLRRLDLASCLFLSTKSRNPNLGIWNLGIWNFPFKNGTF